PAQSGDKEVPGGVGAEPPRVPSLDLFLKNNRNTNEYPGVLDEFEKGRRKGCGRRSVRGVSADAASEKVVRVDCGVWSCGPCGPKKAKQYKHAIIRIAQREKLCRFLTVTLNPRKIQGEAVPYLRSVFAKWRTYLYRKFGKPITYIAVLEFHKTGVPHLHILVDRFI